MLARLVQSKLLNYKKTNKKRKKTNIIETFNKRKNDKMKLKKNTTNIKGNKINNFRLNNNNKKGKIIKPCIFPILNLNSNVVKSKRALINKTNDKNIKNKNRLTKNIKLNTKNNKNNANNIIKSQNAKSINKNIKNGKVKKENNKNKSLNDFEMNSLTYQDALRIDKRTYCQYYLSLLKTNHILIFTFFQFKDYNSQIIKIYIFFLSFSITYIVSAMFYSDSIMHKIYLDDGAFDFTYQLPQMFYSFTISTVLKTILNYFGLYEKSVISMKFLKNKDKEYFAIKCKILFFFIISYILIFCLWICLGCFCAVYKNTQIHLLLEALSSFAISFISPIFTCLIPGLFRIPSLKDRKGDKSLLFKFSKFFQLF